MVDLSLYLVTDRDLCLGRNLENIVVEAVKGGVTLVQLREKSLCTAEFVAEAKRLKAALLPFGVPLIINDRIDVALACDADGVHIGQSDMSYEDARRLLGKDKIIGLSVENFEQLEEAHRLPGLDYVAFSPIFGTKTKTDIAKPFGIEGVRKGLSMCKLASCAIGGINLDNVEEVMSTGLDGVAVVSAICSASDPQKVAKEFKTKIFNEIL